jgi:ribonucleoside-diphosphate reductase alpha chain
MVTVNELSPSEHLKMQAAAQANVDSSISKTINVPADFPFERFVSVYEEAFSLGLKGCTTFRPNQVTGSVLSAAAGEKRLCPSCGSENLAAKEGCMTCADCGFALCG